MEKQELMKELEENYSNIQKVHGIKTNLEGVDRVFFIKDMVLKDGFVSERLSRRICHRIMETYMDWNGYLHSIIMPNPQNMLNIMESKLFDQNEKKEITDLIKKVMEIGSRNSVLVLARDEAAEAKFIDDAVDFWESELRKKMQKIMKKVNAEWGKE